LKAAVESSQPPTAVLLSDPSHKEWNVWDYRLIKAYHISQDWYRDGIPVWWDESDRVIFDAKARISKSRAAVQRAEEAANKKKNVHGRYFIAEPRVADGGDWPTRDEWLIEQANKNKQKTVSTKFGSTNDPEKILQGRK
jgi:hypothetical protein